MGNVYILQHGDENLFKIGMTRGAVGDRVKGLITGNPHSLTVYDTIETDHPGKVEAFLQGLLRSKRSRRSDATEFYAVEPSDLDAAIAEARDFNEHDIPQEAEVEKLAAQHCTDQLIIPSDDDWATYEQLLLAREHHDAADHARKRLEWKLKLKIGTAGGMDRVATWKTQSRQTFDAEAFKEAHPDLHAHYVRETFSRPFLLL